MKRGPKDPVLWSDVGVPGGVPQLDSSKTVLRDHSRVKTVNGEKGDVTSVMPITGGTFTGDISVPDEAYGVGWNGSVEVPTKNAVYDKIQTLGAGTVTDVTGTSPIASSGGATPAISIANAKADGTTKGAAAFTAADFSDDGAGLISIDYTNGQAASAGAKGFLTAADWNTFDGKQAALGFTAENVANKSTDTALGSSNTLYPSQNAVKTYVDGKVPKVYYQIYPMNGAAITIATSATNLTSQNHSPPCPKTASYKLRCTVALNAVTGGSTVFTFQTGAAVSCVSKSPAGSPPPATAETTLFAANTALGTFTKSGNFAAGDAFYVESSAFNLTAGDILKYGGNTVGIFLAAKINTGTNVAAMISVSVVEQ